MPNNQMQINLKLITSKKRSKSNILNLNQKVYIKILMFVFGP